MFEQEILGNMKKLFWLFFTLILIQSSVEAQEDIFGIERKLTSRKSESNIGNVTRNFLSFLNFELSSGLSYHADQFIYDATNQLVSADELNRFIKKTSFSGDSLFYDGYQYSVPIHFGVRFEMLSFLTLGGGVSRETGFKNIMRREEETLVFSKIPYQMMSYYGTAGLVIFDANRRKQLINWRYRKYSGDNYYMQSIKRQRLKQRYPWRIIIEGEIGKSYFNQPLTVEAKFSEETFEFNSNPISTYYGMYLRGEYIMSEYTKIFMRGGTSYRSSNVIQTINDHQYTLNQNLYTLNAGIVFALPGNKRCRKPGCGVVMKHYHDGVEYRGSSIFQLQQRKIGQWY
jgi:hypothetical protein